MTTYIGASAPGATPIAIGANLKVAGKYTLGAGLTINGIQAYMDGLGTGSGVSNVYLGIYADSGGTTPTTLLAVTPSFTVADGAAAGWYGAALGAAVAITSGVKYFAFLTDNTRVRIYHDVGAFGDEKYIADTFVGGMADPFGGFSNDQSVHSIRAYDSLVTVDSCLPDADIVTTGWATAPLFSKVNDASDATVIQATAV